MTDVAVLRTNIIVVLDESGSMEPLVKDTVGGYNTFLAEQRSMGLPNDRWTLITFNDMSKVRLANVPLMDVPHLTPETYRPSGNTALLDALADAITSAPDEPYLRHLVLVQTDGEENSSVRITTDNLRKLISDKERAGNWTFVYMGAGVDAFKEASKYSSVHSGNVLNYRATPDATEQAWLSASAGASHFRASKLNAAKAFYNPEDEPDDDGRDRHVPSL